MLRMTAVLRGRKRDANFLKGMIAEISESGDRPRSIPPRRWDDTRTVNQESHPHLWNARNTPGKRALNPRKQFIAQRVLDALVKPAVSVVVHYNGLDSAAWHDIRQKALTVGFAVVVLPNMTTKRVLEGTPFSNMAPLFWSSTCVMHGDELGNVESLLKVLKAPSFLVVGAKVDNRLLTPAQLKDAAKLPGMDAARAMLVASISPASQLQRLTGMLMAPAQGFHSTLQSSQSGLVSALQRHASKSDDEKQ